MLQVPAASQLLGVVASNQSRKDWGTVFQVLKALGPTWTLWAHVDKLINYWSLPALAEDLEVKDQVRITQNLPDETLAQLYSACSATFAPGLGEGLGFPIIESAFCETPCVHVDYAGGADLIDDEDCLVFCSTYRLDGAYPVYRPVLDAGSVVETINLVAGRKATRPMRYSWTELWPRWKAWIQEGL